MEDIHELAERINKELQITDENNVKAVIVVFNDNTKISGYFQYFDTDYYELIKEGKFTFVEFDNAPEFVLEFQNNKVYNKKYCTLIDLKDVKEIYIQTKKNELYKF